jgi:pheromone alpha factor receptor
MTAIFAILQYVNYEVATSFPQAGTLGLALVALLLPLSSLWAGMVIDDESANLNISYLSGNNMQIPDTTRPSRSKESGNTILSSTREDYVSDRKGSFGEIHRSTIDSKVESGASPYAPGRDSTELDLEAMGVRIDKSYGVQNGKGQSA